MRSMALSIDLMLLAGCDHKAVIYLLIYYLKAKLWLSKRMPNILFLGIHIHFDSHSSASPCSVYFYTITYTCGGKCGKKEILSTHIQIAFPSHSLFAIHIQTTCTSFPYRIIKHIHVQYLSSLGEFVRYRTLWMHSKENYASVQS